MKEAFLHRVLALCCAALLFGCAEPAPSIMVDAAVPVDAGDAVVVADCDAPAPEPGDPIDWSACSPPRIDLAASLDAAGPACVPARSEACTCADGARGLRRCTPVGRWFGCLCNVLDGGVLEGRVLTPLALPPRLVRPMSGMHTSSRRPTLRWVLPDGLARARVEIYEERAGERPLLSAEVNGNLWRPESPLPSRVLFWRVLGLREDGSVGWTSATWEFGVGRCDAPLDTTLRSIRDFNGDGFDDALIRTTRVQRAAVLWGGVDPPRSPITAVTSDSDEPSLLDAAFGDINGDGLADVAIGDDTYRLGLSWMDGQFYPLRLMGVLYGDRRCGLVSGDVFNGTHAKTATCDINGDGFADVLGASEEGIMVYAGSRTGLPREPSAAVSFSDAFWPLPTLRLGCGDINGDGYGDAVVGNFYDSGQQGAVTILYGHPSLRLDLRVQHAPSPRSALFGQDLAVTELDDDGFADVVVASQQSFWRCRGSSAGLTCEEIAILPSRVRAPGPYAPSVHAAGDFDQDGRADVIANLVGTAVYLSSSQQRGGWHPSYVVLQIEPSVFSEQAVSPGDFDGDGHDDFIQLGRARLMGLKTSRVLLHLRAAPLLSPPSFEMGFDLGSRLCCN